jgi:8-hydroxy-5-deazaflavin:NADPH oxidoreductase
MQLGVFGTGAVGVAIGTKLVELGHAVKMGARSASNEKAAAWAGSQGANASHGTFADAAAFGEVLFNCTAGAGSLAALEQAGADNLGSKVLVDISNPLDFSQGFPPSLTVCNTDSLAEQLQRAFPNVRVVKTLNTVTNAVMVNPSLVPGEHDMFLAGNDAEAKAQVGAILREWFGWQSVIDLGDLTNARALEAYLLLWVRLYGAKQSPFFNIKVVGPGAA